MKILEVIGISAATTVGVLLLKAGVQFAASKLVKSDPAPATALPAAPAPAASE